MIWPEFLKPGDLVSIVAPSGKIGITDLDLPIAILSDWGLKVQVGKNTYQTHDYLAGEDQVRLDDLQKAINSTEVQAIFCARGGYGMGRILDSIDFTELLQSPKWIVGFSDLTLLHMRMHQLGLISVHGPVARQLGSSLDNKSANALRSFLFGKTESYEVPAHKLNKKGDSKGPLIGGNLALLCNNIGSATDVDFTGKILILEDTGEKTYAVDRYLNQLARSEKLGKLKGLVIGQFTPKPESERYRDRINQLILQYVSQYDYPVSFGWPVGHEKQNIPLPISANVSLIVNQKKSSLDWS